MAAATYESSLLLRIILMAFILSLNDTQLTHCKHARNHWAMATAESTMPRLGTCRIDGEYMMQISAKLASFVAAAVYVQWCDVFEGLVTHASKLFFVLIPIRLRHCAVLQLETWAMQNTGPCKTIVFDLFLNSDRLVVIITNLRLVAYYQLNFDRSCFLHFLISLWHRQTWRDTNQKMLGISCQPDHHHHQQRQEHFLLTRDWIEWKKGMERAKHKKQFQSSIEPWEPPSARPVKTGRP